MPEFNLKDMIDLTGIKFDEMGVKLCTTVVAVAQLQIMNKKAKSDLF